MPLFQTSLIKKNIKSLDPKEVEKAFTYYSKHFLNPTIQDNIRNCNDIDRLVYSLYELNEEEISLIEQSRQ